MALKINRVWAMPNKWTFQVPPIADLLSRYVGDGKGWIDPFAGETSPWAELKDTLSMKIKPSGIVISFGWNSEGFGIGRGYTLEEILLVAHGSGHNDTIVTVERKVQGDFRIKANK